MTTRGPRGSESCSRGSRPRYGSSRIPPPLYTPLSYNSTRSIRRECVHVPDTVIPCFAGRSKVLSISPDASVYDAIALMAENSIGALLVVSDGKLAGILSERDYARKVVLQSRSSKDTRVRDIMTSPVVTVTPTHTVEECMRLMTDKRIRHLPVVEGHVIVGIVSIGDLVRSMLTVQGEMIQQLQQYINGPYQH